MNLFDRLDTTQKILVAGFLILAIGEAYLLIKAAGLSSTEATAGDISNPANAAVAQEETAVPSSALSGLVGQITAVGQNSIDVNSSHDSGNSISILIASTTQIMQPGALKPQAQQDAEMEQFHEYSDQLMQDPQKNQAALEHLVAPSSYEETTLSLANLSVGETVSVVYDATTQTSSGVTAYQIILLPALAATTSVQ